MSFDLTIPDPEETKEQVTQDLAVSESYAETIDTVAQERGEQIMKVNLDSIADRRSILDAVESLGSDIVKQSSAKNEILSRRMAQLSRDGSESGEVARGLSDLSIKMKDLDPSAIDFTKEGMLGKLFNPVRRYFERYKTADAEIAGIVESLERIASLRPVQREYGE